jgi:predicted amidohydrolase YtcJ
MWDQHPTVEAVAVQGDRFIAAGSNADVLKTADAKTRKIDLHGACVVPGLIAGHVHGESGAR